MMHHNAYDYNPPQRRIESQESYSGSRISEVSKSKEFSDYEMNTKKKSGVGRRSADLPSEGDLERQRNLEAMKWNRREGKKNSLLKGASNISQKKNKLPE